MRSNREWMPLTIMEGCAPMWGAGLGSLVAQHHAQSGGQHFLVTSRMGRSNGASQLYSSSTTGSVSMVAADVASRADMAAIRSCSAWQSYVVGSIVHAGEALQASLIPLHLVSRGTSYLAQKM